MHECKTDTYGFWLPFLSNSASQWLSDDQWNADWYVGIPKSIELLMDEITCSTEYILGEEDCKAFVSVLSDYGIETAEQFIDAFCVEYEGIVESGEFVMIAFNGNTYFFRRLCSITQRKGDDCDFY